MYLQVKVQPSSPKTEFVERMPDETFKIRLKAKPEKGQANKELISYLAKLTGVDKNDILIISGHTHTRKLVKLPDTAIIPW